MEQSTQHLVSVAQAAAQVGIARQSFDQRLRARGIKPHRFVRGGRVSCMVDQDQIRAAMEEISIEQAHSAPDQLHAQLHAQLLEPEGACAGLHPGLRNLKQACMSLHAPRSRRKAPRS